MEPTTLPDPTVSTLDKLYSSGAFFCLGILVLFFVVRYLTKHWGWLRDGQRHVWAVAFLGGLAVLVVPATQGATPNTAMLVTVAITIASIAADPKKIAALTGALTVAGVLFASSGCAWLKGQAHDVKAALVDCTKAERAKLVDEFKPTVETVIAGAVSRARGDDGAIDWGKVKSDAGGTLKSLAKETGACVAADVFAGWVSGKKSFAGPAPDVTPDAARAGFNVLRAELWPGLTYHTAAGDL
jgi:hypothetical protein